ncbi:acetate kinase [Denitrovibrio acetiphilus DSM 12809]|uniref:Acetate kinase n=1 Tax=Denitrovibrio acetiphilus (strain DSM 12809 / NBRC 114555 / N2460) TaxID=522772 RepID=D4H6H7_DENA2|nr:acetate kinase [Denitrovibrio acetiphilus]ADD69651.1 acetate kinase [Denitrovibrio acetiphilus DSM 12809]
MDILALNCGSSSVKYQLYDWENRRVIAKGVVERIGIGDSFIVHEADGKNTFRDEYECHDHATAVSLIVRTLTTGEYKVMDSMEQISAVGHRVVHGGDKFASSVLLTPEIIKTIEDVQHLAPLHNPPNLAGIRAAQKVMPNVPHVAIFDTAFHQTMPQAAYIYPVPYEWYEDYGVRRYGFHGTSHLYVSKRAAVLLGKDAKDCNIITMHIGNGVSHTAIKNGVSVDTSMGLTPLEGAMMGTRCGDIDPAVPLFMQQQLDVDARTMDNILNKKSGVLGITGRFTDRRDVLMCDDVEYKHRCSLAVDVESYRLRKYIGSYYAVLGRLDAIVFTAGVGENAGAIRQMALEGLEHMGIEVDREKNLATFSKHGETEISTPTSKVKVFVIPTNEEIVFIEDVVAILNGTYRPHTEYPYSFAE